MNIEEIEFLGICILQKHFVIYIINGSRKSESKQYQLSLSRSMKIKIN